MVQAGPAEGKPAWPPLPSKLTLLGIAYDSGSIRICSAALLELMHLSPAQLAKLGLSAGGAATGPQGIASQVQCMHMQLAKPQVSRRVSGSCLAYAISLAGSGALMGVLLPGAGGCEP